MEADRRPSRWRLAFQGYVALIVAFVVGGMASLPVAYSRVPFVNEMTILVGEQTGDELSLVQWGSTQPGILEFKVERSAGELWVRSTYRGSTTPLPHFGDLMNEVRTHGFEIRGSGPHNIYISGGATAILTDPVVLASLLAGVQLAMVFVARNRMRAAAKRGSPFPSFFRMESFSAIGWGIAGGFVLLLFGIAYGHLVTAVLGHAPPSPWDTASEMSASTSLVFLLFGGIGAPIAEEIFFRGYLFGKFKQAGHVGFGLVFSSVLFGVVHFTDFYSVPAICLFGACLAAIYHRTGSLWSPIIAHMVNNGIAVLLLTLS